MSSAFLATRNQMLLGLGVPVAVLLGYFLAEPLQFGSVAVCFTVLALLAFPVLMKWHHPLLVLSWNAAINPVFLPGRPYLWMLTALMSVFFIVLNRSVSDKHPLLHVPSVTKPVLAMLAVVVGTAVITGGIGVRSLGASTYGGRGYVYLVAAIAGYFALASQRIPQERWAVYLAMFYLPGLTPALANLAYLFGDSFYWLFHVIPPAFAADQARAEFSPLSGITRMAGLAPAALALYCWLMARHGISGILEWRRPWRLGLVVVAVVAVLYSGFRSTLLLFGLLFVVQFYFEGLHRSRWLPIMTVVALFAGVLLLCEAEKLPPAVQRTLSFLPIKIDPLAKASADHSTNWRLQMWRELLPDVPGYLLIGKGYSLDPGEQALVQESMRRGYLGAYETALLAGDYHSGPLTTIIPLGIWGLGAFVWFLIASVKYLYANYKHGPGRLSTVNTFLLSYFVARSVFFMLIYGTLYRDLYVFAGLVGLAAAFNGRDALARGTRIPD